MGGWPAEAVVIHKVDTTLPDRNAQVVDPDGNGDPNDAGARFLPGETFKDAANGISVRVNDVTANSYNLTINPSAAQPPNDNFANAQAISGATTSVNGTTKGATREVGEPDHYTSNPADASWWLGDHSV